jgi:Cu-processing system ATP-binding protein
MITINNISKHFGKLKALDQLNLQFNSGECIALIGPNGSGKTTLIKYPGHGCA